MFLFLLRPEHNFGVCTSILPQSFICRYLSAISRFYGVRNRDECLQKNLLFPIVVALYNEEFCSKYKSERVSGNFLVHREDDRVLGNEKVGVLRLGR